MSEGHDREPQKIAFPEQLYPLRLRMGFDKMRAGNPLSAQIPPLGDGRRLGASFRLGTLGTLLGTLCLTKRLP